MWITLILHKKEEKDSLLSSKKRKFVANTRAHAYLLHALALEKDHYRRKAKRYNKLLRSVIKGLVARRDTVGGVAFWI